MDYPLSTIREFADLARARGKLQGLQSAELQRAAHGATQDDWNKLRNEILHEVDELEE